MEETNKSIGIIILAAGEAKRFDYFPKQLLKFNNKTLIRSATETALNSETDLVCVVLGANFEKLQTEIADLPIEIVVNENWSDGISSTIQAGLKKLLEREEKISGVLIMLCDQPLIDSDLLNRLIEDFKTKENLITACEYAETFGVPAIFSHRLFDEIFDLSADAGAKNLIKKYADSVKKIPAPQAVFDIDTPQDFAELVAKS